MIVEHQRADYPHVFGDGPGVFYTSYFHMAEAPAVGVSDPVTAGQTLLGYQGNTGTGGTHVHIEVRDFGNWFYPDGTEWGIGGGQDIYGERNMRDSAVLSQN